MPTPTRGISIPEFALLLDTTSLTRKIVAVHVHHTWRPRRRDFRGASTIEAMRRYHVETNHWIDIAQHLTIDPEGMAWVGRNWNLPPASSPGFNGTAAEGPFMIEMIGDFDMGADPFDGAQRDAAFEIVARLLQHFGLGESAIRFHRDLHSPKTCPGTGIDYPAFQSSVQAARAALPAPAAPRAAGGRSPFSAEYRSRHAVPVVAGDAPADAEVPENPAAGRDIDDLAREAECARQNVARGRPFSVVSLRDQRRSPEWNVLRPHVVDLSRGVLSDGGQFRTTPDDLLGVVDAIRSYRAGTDRPHLVLYAHGGLVDETSALGYAKTVLPWWKEYGVFPVFFIWETGLLEILRQYVIGPRDIADVTTDPMIEAMVRIPGTIAWNGIKESARLASSPDAGGGFAGGALQFARELAPVLAGGDVHVHAIGHSAGSIFHAFLLPLLRSLNVNIDTLSLLAPAVRSDVFKETLLPLVGKGIGRLSCFTMQRDAERQDDCFALYRKSLLYLVSRAFEGSDETPILGLDEYIRKDAELAALFGVNGGASPAELQLSYAPGRAPNPLTRALRHGDFDNDPATMSAVLRRILSVTDNTRLGEDDFPYTLEPRTLSLPPARQAAALSAGTAAGPVSAAPSVTVTPAASRTRGRALCIGIDNYPQHALAGCVNDARNWGRAFEQLGFDVTYLLDTQATRQAMVDAIARLVASGDPQTPLVLQYAGHGTQMPDDNGDEEDHFDEALVPIDFGDGHFLIDDDLALLLAKLPAGASITLFMDCCHSGTNSRFAPLIAGRGTQSDRVRYLPPSAELVEAHRRFRAGMPAAASRGLEQSVQGVIHFAACMDNEFAWESSGHGDFTTSATGLLVGAVTRGDANEAFIGAVQAAVQQKGRQHPQMMPPPANMAHLRLLSARVVAV